MSSDRQTQSLMESESSGSIDRSLIRMAYISVRDGFSADRVITDPALNDRFIDACRTRNLSDSIEKLNLTLMNARKGSHLSGLPRSKNTSFSNEDDYAFAAEIAIRFLERRDGISLDRVICSPDRASEFDQLASRLAPGYSSLQYRWAALNLRKRKALKPEQMSHVVVSEKVKIDRIEDLEIKEVTVNQGLYVFTDSESKKTLYVGEASNLRKRLSKHLEHSDNKGLAHWIWEHGIGDIWLEIHELPHSTTRKVRRALEYELIQSREPIFNVLGR